VDDQKMSGASVASIPEHVLARTVGEEVVLLNLDNEQYYSLDATGTRFWELLAAGTSLDDAVSTLAQVFEVGDDVIRRDLQSLVDDLVRQGLLVLGSVPPAG